jgi:hypothetical protein
MASTASGMGEGPSTFFFGGEFMDHENNDTTCTTDTAVIACTLVPEHLRSQVTADLFGANFPLQLEPAIFSFASQLSDDYSGGYWYFYQLGNDGFYMAPHQESGGESDGRGKRYQVVSLIGNECSMSADALGIAACLFAYSHLSFGQGSFAETCAEHYHRLREFMLDHAEASHILRIID